MLPGGDHTIFVGEVVAAQLGDATPLLYFRSAYRHLA
jgi:flavin reductase (DIM6/NTAB) family NADH-FMN oxidoreductase RutF